VDIFQFPEGGRKKEEGGRMQILNTIEAGA
jgi:hypothetical protein